MILGDFEGMRYEVYGAGRPILLLHGWGSNAQSFAKIRSELALDNKVFCVDLWGFGGSDKPTQSATIYDYAEAIYRFIYKIIGEKTVILGHSFGGRICLILGNRPLVRGVVLVDSAGLRGRVGFLKKLKIRRYKALQKKVALGKAQAEVLSKFGSNDYRNLPPEMRGVFVRVVNEDLTKFAQDLRKPTLIVWGKRDRTTPPYMARKLHRFIANSRLVVIYGGHFSYLDSPKEFVNSCSDFLKDLEEKYV